MGPCEHLGPNHDRLGALFSERLSVGLLLEALLRKILGNGFGIRNIPDHASAPCANWPGSVSPACVSPYASSPSLSAATFMNDEVPAGAGLCADAPAAWQHGKRLGCEQGRLRSFMLSELGLMRREV